MLYKFRVPQNGEKGDNEESGYSGYTNQAYRRGRRRATMKRAEKKAIHFVAVGKVVAVVFT